MKKSSKRALSRVMATVMMVSSMFTNVAFASDTTVAQVNTGSAVEDQVETPVAAFAETTQATTEAATETTTEAPLVNTEGKIDAWDFGADMLDETVYNNNLTVDVAVGIYPEGTVADTGVALPSEFTLNDAAGKEAVKFVSNKLNNRYRTMNQGIPRHDDKSKTDADGNVYNGYIYSNSSSTDATSMSFYLYEGDILSTWLGSNGGTANYVLRNPNGEEHATFNFTNAAGVEKAVFYGAEEGWYQLYCADEKLVIARILREHTPMVTISGTIDAPESIPASYEVVITNNQSGQEVVAPVVDGKYSANVHSNYDYTLTLKGADAFVISQGAEASVSDADLTNNITIQQVPFAVLNGNITGLPDFTKASFKFIPQGEDAVYVPVIEIKEDGSYAINLEQGREYVVEVSGVDDYAIDNPTIKFDADQAYDINFTAKPVYNVTIAPEGCELADLANATFTFTNLDTPEYVYTFTGTDAIALRNGTYSVKVANSGAFIQQLTANVVVKDSNVTRSIRFSSEPYTKWDFTSDADWKASAGFGGVANATFQELVINLGTFKPHSVGSSAKGSVAADGSTLNTIAVPTHGKAGTLKVSTCYDYNITMPDGTNIAEKTGSTSQIDTFTCAVDGTQEYAVITVGDDRTSYICSIEYAVEVPYRETLEVGADKEFKTITDALAVAEAMVRPNDERVKIVIDPGNYEEMLVVRGKNISLINAAGASSSIALKNKGVDIDSKAVRITSYYGHGYDYFSMTTDCKYSDEVLEVNKENGYASFPNPGTGKTNNSYWNATVTVRGEGFVAENIIFENSFNQYISKKEANDVVQVWETGAPKGGARPTTYGDTTVQNKNFIERAACMAILGDKALFNNCRFVGHQDTLFGDTNVRAYFNKGVIMGGTDYIMGPMIAVFEGSQLMITTSDDSNDISYLTAAQQSSGRGFLFSNCSVVSAEPGVDNAANNKAKAFANYLGRPWQPVTSETVFYNTTIGTGYDTAVGDAMLGDVDGNKVITASDAAITLQYVLNPSFNNASKYNFVVADVDGKAGVEATDSALILQKALRSTTEFVVNEKSLINGQGWNAGLGGKAAVYEYGTIELGVTDGQARVDWSTILGEPVLPDGTEINAKNWMADWDWTTDLVDYTPVELDETTVYVVGDSTGCDYAATADSNYYYKRVGFGTRLGDYLDDKATVVNYALSGRSSKSFTTEANYAALKSNIKKGDYLIIAFGHNDEKAEDAARYTEPMGDKDTAGSFKNSLYVNYIQPALEVGATPILCTPTVRRTDSGSWSDNQLHVANGKSYADCVRELGAELGLTVLDNTADTKALYDELTPAESINLHAWLNSNKGVDNTHLNNYGASYVAYLMASALKKSDNGLGAYVGDITAPDKAKELIVNPDYVEATDTDLEGDALISKYWKTTSPFYATAFGDIGGQSKLNTVTYAEDGVTVVSDVLTINDSTNDTNFAINELSENSVQIRTGNVDANASFGKIAGTTDAFTLYYIPVDASSNFELSATANVNNVLANNSQTSFGAICLDTIEVDTNNKRTYDYVAAGAVKYGAKDAETGAGAAYLTFARDAASNTLSTNVKGEYAPAKGDVVNVKITKVGDKITATYGNTTSTYDKAMSGKVYIGLYTTRNADVTFTNITYNNEVTE